MAYTQLTREQRYQIRALMRTGHSQTEIAEALEFHKSTISRELRRNRGKQGYRPKQAHAMAMERRGRGRKRIDAATWAVVEKLVREDWSPEQVSNRFRRDHDRHISHEWIYQYILADQRAGGDLAPAPALPRAAQEALRPLRQAWQASRAAQHRKKDRRSWKGDSGLAIGK